MFSLHKGGDSEVKGHVQSLGQSPVASTEGFWHY